jgi:putative oxidoreductase
MAIYSVNKSDRAILLGRVFLVSLFLIFGFDKLLHYSATVGYMKMTGAPWPPVAALIAIVAEVGLSIALMLGVFTRPLAILLAIYTLGTAIIAHHFWTMTGVERAMNQIHFYKNVSIIGGLVLLAVTGAGRYSIDARIGRRA